MLWLWERKGIHLLTSEYAIEEARRNLVGADCQERLARCIATLEVVSTPPLSLTIEKWLGVRLPGKDQPILAAAINAAATHLLTGDKKHFGNHFGRRIRGVLIQTPAQYRLSKSRGRRGN
jgi:predicted nucleic acid-binding protein